MFDTRIHREELPIRELRRLPSQRILEMIPGLLIWTTLLGGIVLSFVAPSTMAYIIILYDLYWLVKSIHVSLHLISSFNEIQKHGRIDWQSRLLDLHHPESSLTRIEKEISTVRTTLMLGTINAWSSARSQLKALLEEKDRISDLIQRKQEILDPDDVHHIVIYPSYRESFEVLEGSVSSIEESGIDPQSIWVVMALEEREGEAVNEKARLLRERFTKSFGRFLIIIHPDGIEGEAKVKGANMTYAMRLLSPMIREEGIDPEKVLVSAFDADTCVSQSYFPELTYLFCVQPRRLRCSYQPIPMYHNNYWDAPAPARVAATGSSFWQMVEASRPDRLITFSSHAMPLVSLESVDYWPVDLISDDSRIFWRAYIHFNGDYFVQPMFSTVSMDALLSSTWGATMVGQYKQKRRWANGVENFPYIARAFWHHRKIPLRRRLLLLYRMMETFYSWATTAIVLGLYGWLPRWFGGEEFLNTVLAQNFLVVSRFLMTAALIGLIVTIFISFLMLPKRRGPLDPKTALSLIAQWIWAPVNTIVFGSIPAIDAQTRILFGKYMEFWVAPKHRGAMQDKKGSS